MDNYSIGKVLIYIGLFMVIIGGLIHLLGGSFSWFGRLPGDIRIEKENFRFYFPITTMILISIIINLFLRIIRYFLK
jgi:hypothetical protein